MTRRHAQGERLGEAEVQGAGETGTHAVSTGGQARTVRSKTISRSQGLETEVSSRELLSQNRGELHRSFSTTAHQMIKPLQYTSRGTGMSGFKQFQCVCPPPRAKEPAHPQAAPP